MVGENGRFTLGADIFCWGEKIVPDFFCETFLSKRSWKILINYVGVSLNGGTPKTPQNDHF